MFRPIRFVLVMMLLLGVSFGSVQGQTLKGKSVSKDSKPAAGVPQEKGSPAPEVVKPAKSIPLKVWEVNTEGSSFSRDANWVIGVERIVYYSDRRMRWWFYLKSKGDRNFTPNIVGSKIYVAGPDGEAYRPIATQHKPDREGIFKVAVQAGTLERFWVDFPVPKEDVDTFKVGVPVSDFLLAGTPLPPFSLTLVEPISEHSGEPKPVVAIPAGAPVPVEPGPAVGGAQPTGAGDRPIPKAEPKPSTKPGDGSVRDRMARAVRDIPEKGQSYEGNIRPKQGENQNGGIRFDVKSSKGAISARIYRKPGSPLGVKLTGTIVEDETVSAGIKLELLDPEDVTYWFVLDGKSLSGKDSLDNHYSFMLKP